MIDLKQLREHPDTFKQGAAAKRIPVDIDRILSLDSQRRAAVLRMENLRAEQRKIEKELGPKIGQLAGALKKADPASRAGMEQELEGLKAKPAALKAQIQEAELQVAAVEPALNELLLQVPLPPDSDVPTGSSADDNVELSRWAPPWFNFEKGFEGSKGFKPRTHMEIVRDLRLVDFERGVKMAGTRSYVLTGDGMRLHLAVLRFATDFMTQRHGFQAMSVPVIVREEAMVGTGFFPAGREQPYHSPESQRKSADDPDGKSAKGYDLFLTGTGEVGLMGIHQGEILDESTLPRMYTTVSTCFRREAGAAGKDTAGLYRIHQFDKVEQVVICRADAEESKAWHRRMIGFVEELLKALELPYRLLQCCTADLGPKNASMVDIECWMPGRGDAGPDGRPKGAFGETHSASRLYDFQCRRLNMRYRPGGEGGKGDTTYCHSLNNTVLASPRILIPLLEMYQNADQSVTIPPALRPYMNGQEKIG